MKEALLAKVRTNEMRCSVCNKIIPFTFKKGPEYTCPSFTMVENKPVCYYDLHPEEYSRRKK
jgi:hypothetical protein